MVSIDVTKLASQLKSGAKDVLKNLKENPAEGSIFDAANKLGINSKEDLMAGVERFKADPAGTADSILKTLSEKGFKFSGTEEKAEGTKEFSVDNIGKSQAAETTKATTAKTTTAKTAAKTQTPQIEQKTTTEEAADTVEEETTETGNTQEFGGVFGKLGIKNEADLQAAVKKFKENPKESAQSIAKTLGLSDNITAKLSSIISKFTKA